MLERFLPFVMREEEEKSACRIQIELKSAQIRGFCRIFFTQLNHNCTKLKIPYDYGSKKKYNYFTNNFCVKTMNLRR